MGLFSRFCVWTPAVYRHGAIVERRTESVEPAGAACRVRAFCAVDYRLRRISDMDALRHGMTNPRHLPKFDCGE